MAILGPLIQAARGGVIKYNNYKLIDELRSEVLKDILDGFDETEKKLALVKYKEVELELAVIKNEPRKIISKIEGELISLMNEKMNLMENELKKETATRYDLASTVISFQKANKEVKDYLVEMDYRVEDRVKHQEKRLKETQLVYNREFDSTKAQLERITKELEIKKNEITKLNQKIKNIVTCMVTLVLAAVTVAGYFLINI